MSDGRHAKRRGAIKVFLSHSNVHTEVARKVRNLLVYRTSAQVSMSEDLNAGQKWETELRKLLASADVVLAFLPQSVDSSWVLLEIGAAWAIEKPIIPVITRRDVLNKMPAALEGTRTIAPCNNPTSVQTTYQYDALGNLRTISAPLSKITTYQYDAVKK